MKRFFKNLGDLWLILGATLLILIFIEIFFKFYFYFKSEDESRLQADCYSNEEWVNEYYKEFNACNIEEWESYVYWRRKPYAGEYINVDVNQRRKTTYGTENAVTFKPDYRIFMFGGSTMWGTGVRDPYTLPSLVGELLSRQGYHVEILNFGESGYVSSQEVISLGLELQKENIPNIVVFYDGVNDVFSSFQQGKAGIPQNEFNREKEFNSMISKKKSLLVLLESLKSLASFQFIEKLTKSSRPISIDYTDQELKQLAKATSSVYQQNMRLVYSWSESMGFQALFYWQPSIFDKMTRTEYERKIAEEVEYIRNFNNLVKSQLIPQDVSHGSLTYCDISDIFNDEKEPVFIDYCHVSELGNTEIAKRMASDIVSILEALEEKEQIISTSNKIINIDGNP